MQIERCAAADPPLKCAIMGRRWNCIEGVEKALRDMLAHEAFSGGHTAFPVRTVDGGYAVWILCDAFQLSQLQAAARTRVQAAMAA